jgi:signal transduction histidine kinase
MDYILASFKLISLKGIGLALVLFSLIPFLISRYFENIFIRLFILFLIFGFYQDIPKNENFFLMPQFWVFFGLLLGQLKFYLWIVFSIIAYVMQVLVDIKNATVNSYYFFITILFKIIRLTRAIIKFFKAMYNFFSNFKMDNFKKSFKEFEEDNERREYARKHGYSNQDYNEYKKQEKENYNRYSSFFDEDEETTSQNYQNNTNEQQYQDFQEQSKKAYEEYQQKEQAKQNQRQQEERYKQEQENQRREEQRQREYQEQKRKAQEKERAEKEKQKNDIPKEFRQFFSDDPYIILGVSKNDDKKVIKTQWKKLSRKYHPDLNCDTEEEEKFYNEVMKRINGAYDKIK